MAAFLRFEIVRSLRNVRFVVFIAGFPVLLYLIYAKQTGTSQGLTVAAILMVSMAVWSGMGSAMFATGPATGSSTRPWPRRRSPRARAR
jgi:ABC-2 type transport system permease protein